MLACVCHSLSLWMACLHRWPISSRARWIALRPARTTSSSPPLPAYLRAPSSITDSTTLKLRPGHGDGGVELLSLPPSQSPLLTAAWGLFLEMPFVSWPPFSRLYPQPCVVLCLASWGSGLFSTLHVHRCSLVSHGMHTSVTVVTLCVCHPFVQQ